jgi:hypothetical protein
MTSADPGSFRRSPFDTEHRHLIDSPGDHPDGPWGPLVDTWFHLGGRIGAIPDYERFDILALPGSLWPSICLTKLIGTSRRFWVTMIGTDVEAHNGFFGNNRLMMDLPLRNRRVMSREFWWTLHHGGPVYSEGPYIGAVDYVRRVRRVITPYRLSEREYAFVFCAVFEAYPEKRSQMASRSGPGSSIR